VRNPIFLLFLKQVAKAYPRRELHIVATTMARARPLDPDVASQASPRPHALHLDRLELDQPGGTLARTFGAVVNRG